VNITSDLGDIIMSKKFISKDDGFIVPVFFWVFHFLEVVSVFYLCSFAQCVCAAGSLFGRCMMDLSWWQLGKLP
jgi:hypothetical protein